MRTLTLEKGTETFVIRYEPGLEHKVLDHLQESARTHKDGFDWFDAAVLSHQLGQHLSRDLKVFLPTKK